MHTYNTTWTMGKTPTVLYFTAPWCIPCRRFGPVMEKVSGTTPGVNFLKVDADEFFEIASKYNVRSLPTLVYLDPNSPGHNETLLGAHSGDEVTEWLGMQ